MTQWTLIEKEYPIRETSFLLGIGLSWHKCNFYTTSKDGVEQAHYVVHGKNYGSWENLSKYWTHYRLLEGPR